MEKELTLNEVVEMIDKHLERANELLELLK